MPGKFITLEGGDGVGKSTQMSRLAGRLEAEGFEVVRTREPGGSPKAEAIRAALLSGSIAPFGPAAEAVMFSAARIDHLDHRVRPALARGSWVISDRFADSTRAYQGVAGDVDPALIAALETLAVGPTRPDLTLVLDVSNHVGLARASARRAGTAPADRFELQDFTFHERLRTAFLAIARDEPDRCVVIDASDGVEAVGTAIWQAVRSRLLAPAGTAAA